MAFTRESKELRRERSQVILTYDKIEFHDNRHGLYNRLGKHNDHAMGTSSKLINVLRRSCSFPSANANADILIAQRVWKITSQYSEILQSPRPLGSSRSLELLDRGNQSIAAPATLSDSPCYRGQGRNLLTRPAC